MKIQIGFSQHIHVVRGSIHGGDGLRGWCIFIRDAVAANAAISVPGFHVLTQIHEPFFPNLMSIPRELLIVICSIRDESPSQA
jgi:hypothetical protein